MQFWLKLFFYWTKDCFKTVFCCSYMYVNFYRPWFRYRSLGSLIMTTVRGRDRFLTIFCQKSGIDRAPPIPQIPGVFKSLSPFARPWSSFWPFTYFISSMGEPGLVDKQTRFTIKRSRVRILFHLTLDGNGVKAMPGQFKYPILVHSIQYSKRKKIQVAKWDTLYIFFKKVIFFSYWQVGPHESDNLPTCNTVNHLIENCIILKAAECNHRLMLSVA